ncbi:MAG: helix-turn-helix transcriptional regulator [Ornithinimicrobium sp.]|jgi:excisionase family DNA binding protein|uniref:helix-turn-helix transcriptional regulator n=1 Tax=Ornithinimicrobium sp. TaxID=1977084 RepID=UPI003D9AC47A
MTQTTARRHYESLTQAAERTGLSTRTLRRRIATGQLTAYRAGPRIIRLDPADVDRLLVPVPHAGRD